jgi:hypothetical protein
MKSVGLCGEKGENCKTTSVPTGSLRELGEPKGNMKKVTSISYEKSPLCRPGNMRRQS